LGLVGALKVRSAAPNAKNITWKREAKDGWSKLQNFDIVMVYMRNKLMKPTLSSCLPAGQSSSFSFQEDGIAAT
jgi:hypothetical protein